MDSKFRSISSDIIQKIQSGEILPGEKVPSENELIKSYGISNTTARKILLEIEHSGWAKRIKGKGTFVLNRTEDHNLVRMIGSIEATRRGFDENLIAEGFTPKTIILEKRIIDEGISSCITDKHFIIEGPVLKIHQLRYADDTLMKDEIRYISLSLCPRIDRLPTDVSYFKTYEKDYRLKIKDIKQTLSVNILNSDTSNNFDVTNSIPVFILDGAVICEDSKVVEIEKSCYNGLKYKFAIVATPKYSATK